MSTLRLTRGDTGQWEFSCVDQNRAPLDLTGAQARFTLKEQVNVTPVLLEKTVDNGIEFTDETAGLLLLELLPADTDTLPATRTYRWDLQLAYDSDHIFTVDTGLFILNADVGRVGYEGGS